MQSASAKINLPTRQNIPKKMTTSKFPVSSEITNFDKNNCKDVGRPIPITCFPFCADKPGEYILCSNREWNNGPEPAISVTSNGVIINFLGYILTLGGNAVGIKAEGLLNLDLTGVTIVGDNLSNGLLNESCSSSTTGLLIICSINIEIIKCLFIHLGTAIRSKSSGGLTISRTIFDDNFVSIILNQVTGVEITHCTMSIEDETTVSPKSLGIKFTKVTDVVFKDNSFHNCPMLIRSGRTIRIESCNFTTRFDIVNSSIIQLGALTLGPVENPTFLEASSVLVKNCIFTVTVANPKGIIINLVAGTGVTLTKNISTMTDTRKGALIFAHVLVGSYYKNPLKLPNVIIAPNINGNNFTGASINGVLLANNKYDICTSSVVQKNSFVLMNSAIYSGATSVLASILDNLASLTMTGYSVGTNPSDSGGTVLIGCQSNASKTAFSIGSNSTYVAQDTAYNSQMPFVGASVQNITSTCESFFNTAVSSLSATISLMMGSHPIGQTLPGLR